MWLSCTSPQNLNLIGLLTTEIYYRTGITGKTDRQTDIQTESDTLPIMDIGWNKNRQLKAD